MIDAILPYAGRAGVFPVYAEGDFAKVPAGAVLFSHLSGKQRSDAVGELVGFLRTRPTTEDEVRRWWGGTRKLGVALNCGDYQCIDFDDPSIIEAWLALLRDNGADDLLGLTARAKTMSGGYHVWAYVPGCQEGSHKLARHAAPVWDERRGKEILARIETRGLGGYALVAPSPGYAWLGGRTVLELPPMAAEDFERLVQAAIMLDEGPPDPEPQAREPRPKRGGGEESPNDWFERTASWHDLLGRDAGGTFQRELGRRLYFRRPPGSGKRPSIVTGNGRAGQDLAHVHTPNWPPFSQGATMSKYYCYALLHHGGDAFAATKAIALMPGFPGRRGRRETLASPSAPEEDDSLDRVEESPCESPLDLPSIQWNARQLPHVTADAIAALVASNDPRHLFDRGGKVVRVVEDKDGGFKIDNVGAAAMRNEVGKAATWTRMDDKGKQRPGYVPKEIAENVLAEQGLAKSFPRLEGLSTVPVLSPSGDFFRNHGYDPESGFYVTGRGPFPSFDGDGVAAASYLLLELFENFPFVTDDGGASRANALALALLPYVRPIIDGPTPMHYVEAPQSRTGKSLLVEVALLPSLGKKGVSSTPLPEKEEELNKALAGMIFEGEQLVFLDNVKRRVNSASLEQLLTAHMLKFRPLGTTASIAVPVKAIFAMTSNNGTMSVDMAGRSVLIRIDARMERPEDRTAFRHEDIRGFIEANRPTIRAACMAMVDHWVRAGRPKGSRRKASYVQWAQTLGGILECCGVEGFLANDKALKGTAADEDEPWRDFYEAWWARFGDTLVKGPDLLAFTKEKKLLGTVFDGRPDSGHAVAWGKAMSAREGKVLDAKRQESPRNAEGKPHKIDGQKTFRLVSVDGTPPPLVDGQDRFTYDAEEVDPFADE